MEQIPGYPNYTINERGEVYSNASKKYIVCNSGSYELWRNNKKKYWRIDDLLKLTFDISKPKFFQKGFTEIPGYKDYEINEKGEVYSHKTKKFLTQYKNISGYVRVSVKASDEEKNRKRSVHHLVAITFIPNPKKLSEVNHKNGIKTDNSVEKSI